MNLCVLRWMDDTPVSFLRWDENQPSSAAFDENCVTMTYHMGEGKCHALSH